MIITKEIGSAIYRDSDYENVNVVSDSNVSIDLGLKIKDIENLLKNYFSGELKKPVYKVVGTNVDGYEKVYVFLEGQDDVTRVINLLTRSKLSAVVNVTADSCLPFSGSLFKQKAQQWCNAVREYLEIEYNFQGTIRMNAVKIMESRNMMRIAAQFIPSGKTTTDLIVALSKRLGKKLSESERFFEDEGKMVNLVRDFNRS